MNLNREQLELDHCRPLELVKRIQAGDRVAENEVVWRYSQGIFLVISQLIPDRFLAEDVYQDTLHLVLKKIRTGRLRDPERLSEFIYSVARNLVIDHFRRHSRRHSKEEVAAEDAIASPQPSQLDSLLSREQHLLARRVLAALPSKRDRTVLTRLYLAESKREDICADLGISSSHLNQILCRARSRYKKLFTQMVCASNRPARLTPEQGPPEYLTGC
jgi:RNA polymerase sigma-70 factor, ECF subfamily